MAITVKDQAELESAISKKVPEIEIEGDLANKVLKIKATGKIAWVISFVSVILSLSFFISTLSSLNLKREASLQYSTASVEVSKSQKMYFKEEPSKIPLLVAALAIGLISGGIAIFLTYKNKYRIIETAKNKLTLKLKE